MRRTFAFPLLIASSWSSIACTDAVVGPEDGAGGAGSTSAPSSADASTSSGNGTQSSPSSSSSSSSTASTANGGGGGGGDGDGDGGGGDGPCEDACDLEDRSCLDDGVITCVEGASGCTIWSAADPCPADAPFCASGACSAECEDECQANDARCTDDGAQHCYATETPDGPCFRWEAPGPCDSANACIETGCEVGVGCTSDPVTCDDPPDSACIDDDTLRVWDATGVCGEDGDCEYADQEVACANCPACDACESVTCDDPPSVCFAATGTCDEGSCSYAFDDDADCDDGDDCTTGDSCTSGVCAGSAMVCDDPDPPTCVDDDTLRTYSASGTCQTGECEYPFVDETCEDGCEAGACSGGWTPTGVAACPAARTDHSAVWTGSRMVVWGGRAPFVEGEMNTGGRYDPATDSWSATSLVGAPTPRYRHTAVWTNSEMIVWGGHPGGVEENGGRYDPATNTWLPMSSVNAPVSYGHTAIWTGSQMLVWGGGGEASGRYTPATDTWSSMQTAGQPATRAFHSAVWTGTEMIIWGGTFGANLNTGGRYNPTTNTWVNLSTQGAPSPRREHRAVWTGSQMIVWGGHGDDALNDGARYDPTTDTWTALPANGAPVARHAHSAVWSGSEMIVWGGQDSIPTETGGAFHPSTNTWTALPTAGAPIGRENHTTIWTGSEMIVWGGDRFLTGELTGGRYAP
jgi:hypothetical protein